MSRTSKMIEGKAPVNDTDLYYVRVGEGLPCLVMHGGFGVDHTLLHPWLDPLGDVLHLVYYDHRCNGRSGRPPIETFTYDQLVDDANELRKYLGFEKIVVIGHSIGGCVALKYALRYPEYLSHLTLIDTAPAWDYNEEILANVERKGTKEMIVAWNTPITTNEEYACFGEVAGPLYWHKFDAELHKRLGSKIVHNVEALNAEGVSVKNYNVVPRLGEIETPTLILVGKDDFICPPSQAERMHKNIPNSEIVIFEQSGHTPYIEESDAFFATVRRWLSKSRTYNARGKEAP